MSITRSTLLLLMTILATSIQAETINYTPITSLPATITAQGVYCLTGNLSTSQASGYAITIYANNVTLDLNGWKLGGQGAGTGTNDIGIYSTADNITIKNGIVRGFLYGIYLTGKVVVVKDILADQNTQVGIYVTGDSALVEHNQVVDTGGTTVGGLSDSEFGIWSDGVGSTINNNVVSGLSGLQAGISAAGLNSTVRDNVVSSSTQPFNASIYGIFMVDGIILNNTVSNFELCISTGGLGIYAYNTVNNCTTADFSGGTAGAGNSGT